jgi:DNA-directed RNA polymerase subunit M/transcription elongation factor TFIIS
MKKTEEILNCGKCANGKVKVSIKETRNGSEMSVKKCDSCKYQYGIKQIANSDAAGRVLRVSTE